jgi:LAS superfamily LD-carboxypeptidase LdcB
MRSESHDDCCGRVRTAAPPDELVWIQGEVHRLVAGPGRTLTSELIVGDVLVRRLPGRRAHVARVADARLRPADELRADGVAVERRDGDRFVEVIEPGAGSRRMGRLALGAGGVVPFDQMIARPLATGAGPTAATPGEDASDALAALAAYPAARLAWADAPAGGVDFMRRVYEAHVRDAARGAEHFVDNVPAAELERILPEGALDEGGVLARLTGRHAFRLHRSAVADARRLLIALATALEHAQEAGDAGARALSHLRVRSAYRSAGEQLGLWQDNFTMHDGYYMATAARRAAQPGGPHGDAAVARTVDYITRYLAAPGFSNHNRGLAIDLGVDQLIDGSTVELTTSRAPGNRQAWRATWVHAWLVANAASYHFVPLATEEWHWSHDARAAAASAPTEDEPCHDPDPLPQEYFVRGGPIACRHRRLVDPALELDPAQLPHEVAPYAPFVQRVVDLLLTLPAEGPRCSIQRALEIVGVYAVETGWGAHYRGNNLGGVTLGSRTQTWWRAPGLSGDSRIMYFAGFPSLAEFCRAWLEQFVPRPGTRRSGSTRWVETGRLFWEGGEWFPALIQGGYRNDQTAHNPQPSIETHRNATGMAARLWACARLGVSLGATPGAAPRRWWPPAAQAACAELQRQHGLPATGTVVAPDRALDLPTLELLATRAPVGATVAPAPAPAPAPRLTEDDPGFREALADVPLLASHRGAGRPADEPDLILRCNSQALTRDATEIDVLVHFHGHARRGTGPALRLRRKELVAGIDYADPLHPEAAAPRTPVTLGIVPRGRFTGGDAYDFPALVAPGAIDALVELGLARLAASIGRPGLRARRLLLTAHSGGGPSLLHALDTLVRAQARVPEVIHIFDALYAPATGLGHWAERMIERDAEALRHLLPGTDHAAFLRKHGGALRVVYTSGGGTVASSVALAGQLEAALQTLEAPLAALLRRQYRVELTDDVPHGHLPRVLGWRLLADPAANLT